MPAILIRGFGTVRGLLTRGLLGLVTPANLPLSSQGAILKKFLDTPALVAAVPGGFTTSLDAGPSTVPFAVLTQVGEVEVGSDSGGTVEWDEQYRIKISARTEAECKRITALFYQTYNYVRITGSSPLRFASDGFAGAIVSAYPSRANMMPGYEAWKRGIKVYSQVFTLDLKVFRQFDEET